ncbi:hypothetical protein [Tichowtungia aerotolerans]|uniref:DUF1963 domain-containing protein n=1 Tax=Tichowtungia aerotolerans TaxID=2697043 RepID=A0A6P1M7U1_9BACT|nr:hypothetical protein [Tichowtungia aerotolerans]QHI70112.1 hypothetical protein GT409_11880 [Tichowtungia aerotolerans]
MSSWLPTRIRQLQRERAEILEEIETLPVHHPLPLPDHYGYHSAPIDSAADSESLPQTIVFECDFDPQLDSIALAPVLLPGYLESGAYAFPKRFKIELQESDGRWIGGKSGYWERGKTRKWVELVNWMDEDFPDPGAYPVFFTGNGRPIYQVRITFPACDETAGQAYHALGEIYLFRLHGSGEVGDTFERVEAFLRDTGQDADYWCAPGSAKRFDILHEGETVTALSPDYENSPEQERRNIDPVGISRGGPCAAFYSEPCIRVY